MNWLIVYTCFAIFVTHANGDYENDRFCDGKVHYNSLTVTCCNGKKYLSHGINPFLINNEMNDCLIQENIGKAEHLITKTVKDKWLMYKCLIEKKVVGSLTLDTFTDFMVKRFPPEVQEKIRASLKIIKKSLPTEYQRKKRSFRIKRDGEDTTKDSLSTDSSTESSSAVSVENAQNDGTASSTENSGAPESNDSSIENKSTTEQDKNEKTTTNQSTDNVSEENTEKTNPPENSSPVTEEEKFAATISPPIPWVHKIYVTTYSFLSVFDYFDSFKEAIPDEKMVRIWDAYYTAEFEACHKIAGHDDKTIRSYSTDRCISWIQRTARAGECCAAAPIPFPLLNDATIDLETVQNHTAEILGVAGTYTWTNYSYSSNIMRCQRLSAAILQNQTKLDDFKSDLLSYMSSNGTKSLNYRDIAGKIIPQYYPEKMRTKIIDEILPTRDPEESKDPNQYYRRLDKDSDIQRISNFTYSVYQWANPTEWGTDMEPNKTRFVMWSCDAYRMISQRILLFDTTPFCYKKTGTWYWG